MATISTSGIAVGQIIRSEHLLRVINALNGVTPIDIIITGSLSTSGSLNVTGSTFLRGLPNTSRANVITYDPTTGQLSYLASASLGVTMSVSQPGGSDTQVQYNSGSVLAGNSAFRFIYNSSSLTLGTSIPTGLYSFTQGSNLTASGNFSYAQGSLTKATNTSAHAEGESTIASGIGSHAEGNFTTASGDYSHAEGEDTQAIGDYSHAEGKSPQAIGDYSHAEGSFSEAIGDYSHAEGLSTIASGSYSHAEGYLTLTSGWYSHAEGYQTIASGWYSHAEGYQTTASGDNSHAEGEDTRALGTGSHAEGLGTIAAGNYQHVQGQYNITSSVESAFIIGNGTADNSRRNLVFASGSQVQITGSLNVSGSITGSLFGTASFATSASFTTSASRAISASFATTASYATQALSASWAPNAGPIEVYNNVSEFGTLYSTAPPGGPASSTTNVTMSIIFGWNAGGQSNNLDSVNFLGNRAGRYTNNIVGSNFIGYQAGEATSASRSNFLGQYTGINATNASDSNFFGYNTGTNASAAPNSNFLGYQAGIRATSASNSNFIGRLAGQDAASASFSTLIGHQVGLEATATASNSIGSNNIIIGTNITLAAQQRNAINLGGIIFATGSYATTTGNPFSGSMPSSRVGIATSTPQFTLDISGSARVTSNLTVTGSSTFVGPVNMGNTTGAGNLTVTSDQPYLFLTRGNGDTSILLNTGDTTVSASLDVLNNQFFEINTNARLKLSTGRKERITIDSTGGIIINSGSQATAPTVLQITGSVSISDILTLTRRTTTPTPVEGMIIASGSAGASILYYYNGTTWNALF